MFFFFWLRNYNSNTTGEGETYEIVKPLKQLHNPKKHYKSA